MRPTKLRTESLEDRTVPSTINWVNDGVNDHFDEVWGAQAGQAREAVRAAIDAWERVIVNFNNGNANTIDLTIRMATDQDVDDYGFGGGNTDRIAGQAPPSAIEVDGLGKPIEGLILLGRGTDGHGAGWYIDPTPDEASEFRGGIVNAFVGAASEPAAQSGQDFVSLVLAELTHAVGVTSASGSRYRKVIDAGAAGFGGVKLTDTGVLDKNYLGAVGPKPTLWAFDGPSVNYLMTDADGGNKGKPVHTASPAVGNSVLYLAEVLKGNHNIGNAGSLDDHRYLVPNAVALMLKDVYGYTLASGGPERFGTFYTLEHSNGQVLVRGASGGDTLAVSRNAATTTARADVAVPVAGTDPWNPLAGGFVSKYANATVQAVRVEARAGNDTVQFAGTFSGLDSVALGGNGNDLIDGTAATSGSLTLYGDAGNDTVRGGAGSDDLFGGDGDDVLRGYGGNDTIAAGAGNDNAQGGTGGDYILGDFGNDFLQGNSGDDTIYAGAGADRVVGGTQVPQLFQAAADGADVLDGEAGDDLVFGDNAFGNAPTPVGGGDDLVLGGADNDTLWGGIGDDTVRGEDGNDGVYGWFGNDTLEGGAGDDTLRGWDGNDHLDGQEGDDALYGDDGNDDLTGGLGADQLRGGDGNDHLVGGTVFSPVYDDSPDTLLGEAGNDTLLGDNLSLAPGNVGGNDALNGGSGDDFIYGQAGNDTVFGGSGDDEIDGGGGKDRAFGQLGDDEIDGGADDDLLYGGDGSDTIAGGAGNDAVRGEGGNDVLSGGDGDDLIRGGSGRDSVAGDAGNDVLLGDADSDSLLGGDGRDVLVGGDGADNLAGGAADDLLVAGLTTFDASDADLAAIRAEWTSAHTYAERVRNLRKINNPTFDQRLNGEVFLIKGTTVLPDGDGDTLNGELGDDWFFRKPVEDATDAAPGETET